ncbi:DUF4097 family beta strand repeat-containing protein [Algoriphagus machipongonensis]|uniref:Adhesin domain-containing protein n=1 Tax=Algoriphagus machipongonensis TaxID=388413 RepID=A3I1K8_9BACT|nr:DUF4097 family beta strand repeat protein [Algoriphagus machipongonensis]EAZ79674.1 hypothetical protein ALPR1_08618 [Algoriphagus machipongonensis]
MKDSTINFIAFSFLLFFASVQQVSAKVFADPYLTKEFTLNGKGNLDVETSGASIAVTGVSGNQVLVEMYVKRNGKTIESSDPEVEEFLEAYDLDISKSGNTISVKVKKKSSSIWRRGNNLNLSFKVQVPTDISSDFQSSGGSISMSGLAGDQRIATSGGSIRIENASGTVVSKSSGGSFSLNDFDGEVDIQTSGGSVKIDGLEGELKINTSGGSVTLEDISGSIDANTSGGSIRAKLLGVDDDLSFRSSGGSISAIVPSGLGLDLDLRGGRVNSKFVNFDGEVKKDMIVGKMNGGGYLLSMQSSGGSINLEFMD